MKLKTSFLCFHSSEPIHKGIHPFYMYMTPPSNFNDSYASHQSSVQNIHNQILFHRNFLPSTLTTYPLLQNQHKNLNLNYKRIRPCHLILSPTLSNVLTIWIVRILQKRFSLLHCFINISTRTSVSKF